MDNIWSEIHESRVWSGYPSEHVIRFFQGIIIVKKEIK